ncbi:MAG TPA: TetR/AcrR family transcriptional regulator [Tepidiformaceae bacterium]|nr:TetR/AcrR family transcriptional regulator [Tepidiformaceae bacterium]
MSPRPYQLGQRQSNADDTRQRVIAAAHALLLSEDSARRFSVDAIARRADVARMTVYNQFGSKTGLLEALFDYLAEAGGLPERVGEALSRTKPVDSLAGIVDAFCLFWASDRLAIRRLRALAVLDAGLGESLYSRNERRKGLLRSIVQRIAAPASAAAGRTLDESVDLLFTLSNFETFDTLAGSTRSAEETTRLLREMALAVVGAARE